MKKVLVTSTFTLPEENDKRLQIDYIPFIETEIYPESQIIPYLPNEVNSFIVTSGNAVQAIKNIELEGDFYVVGKNTAKELFGQNREISFISNYAEDLLERMLETEVKKYVFFKGNLSLSTLPDSLRKNGVEVIGIECYKTTLKPTKVNEKYDALVFMSPSAVKSYLSMNQIPRDALVFVSGKTTAKAVKDLAGDLPVYYPEETTKESLLTLIKETIND
ncbi:uroporphyrinogen-III synthase [Apibacter muscae]|uniref:uroporphyrinogen-III synthase n=1 Tax=Apibacter muscae TaxID=2509004 RepID=UPI0011AC3C6B|nr:uroporphyrinogen-III synthase [Apibacter muscae]TWP30416.1 uroporphyrinogen-III synthase [Apibacter muscae]